MQVPTPAFGSKNRDKRLPPGLIAFLLFSSVLSVFTVERFHRALTSPTAGTNPCSNGAIITSSQETVDRASVRAHFNAFGVPELFHLLGPTWTMVGMDHFKFALDAVKRVNEQKIPGDIVECGVWKGGVSMAMAIENHRDNAQRHLWLFDTFEGLPPPSSEKDDPKAKEIYDEINKPNPSESTLRKHHVESGKWNYGPLEIVKNNMYYTAYPKEKIHFVQGKVEDTLTKEPLPAKIAILRLDTDWYDSTKAELDVLWDRLQSGGVLIVDDYCSWKGAKTAIDEFFQDILGLDARAISKKSPCMHYWKP